MLKKQIIYYKKLCLNQHNYYYPVKIIILFFKNQKLIKLKIDNNDKLNIGDLMYAMENVKSVSHSKKILEEIRSTKPMDPPVRELLKAKQLRRATYQKAVEDIKKWDPIIKVNN